MGEEHWNGQKNHREIPPGELCHGGMRDPIIVDISATRNLGQGGYINGSGEYSLGKKIALYFLRKDKNPLTHSRSSRYDAGQESRTGTPESSDISKGKIPKFSVGKRGTNSGRDGGRRILQLQPTSGTQGRKA